MKKFIVLFIILLSSFCYSQQRKTLLIQIDNITPKKQDRINSILNIKDLDREFIECNIREQLMIVVSSDEATKLKSQGFDYKVILENPDRMNLTKRALYGESMSLSAKYHNYNRFNSEIDVLIQKHPNTIKKISLGQTTQEKSDIYAYKISNEVNVEQDKPAILLEGCIHGNELVGGEICFAAIKYLVENIGKDTKVTDWINSYEIYIIPVINIDGHDVVTNNIDPNWRKSTRDSKNKGEFDPGDGIDINSNFDFNWGVGGSGDMSSGRYRGEYPFSESETIAIRNLAEKRKFLLSITYQSQGEVVYYPWNWGNRKAPDDSLLTIIARGLAESIKTMKGEMNYRAAHGNGATGQSSNWFYGKIGTFDFIVEAGRGSGIFPDADLDSIIINNMNGIKYLLDVAKGPGLTGHIKDLKTGSPLDAMVWFPAIETDELSKRTSEPQNGRFWRLLLPGKYQVMIMKEGYHTKILDNVEIKSNGWTNIDVELESIVK